MPPVQSWVSGSDQQYSRTKWVVLLFWSQKQEIVKNLQCCDPGWYPGFTDPNSLKVLLPPCFWSGNTKRFNIRGGVSADAVHHGGESRKPTATWRPWPAENTAKTLNLTSCFCSTTLEIIKFKFHIKLFLNVSVLSDSTLKGTYYAKFLFLNFHFCFYCFLKKKTST